MRWSDIVIALYARLSASAQKPATELFSHAVLHRKAAIFINKPKAVENTLQVFPKSFEIAAADPFQAKHVIHAQNKTPMRNVTGMLYLTNRQTVLNHSVRQTVNSAKRPQIITRSHKHNGKFYTKAVCICRFHLLSSPLGLASAIDLRVESPP